MSDRDGCSSQRNCRAVAQKGTSLASRVILLCSPQGDILSSEDEVCSSDDETHRSVGNNVCSSGVIFLAQDETPSLVGDVCSSEDETPSLVGDVCSSGVISLAQKMKLPA